MSIEDELRDLNIQTDAPSTATSVNFGTPVPKIQRLKILSPDDWEIITEQWASTLAGKYSRVQRLGGSGDKGVDIVGFYNDEDFFSDWDNYQCKHYKTSLSPSHVTVEIGKLIYHCFKEAYAPPLNYFFVAPFGIGSTLSYLILNPDELKEDTRENWDKRCKSKITSTEEVKLEGEILKYFESFDFSIFDSVLPRELLEGHAKTQYHSIYFGGGLPARDKADSPPEKIDKSEIRYISQLFEAYSESKGKTLSDLRDLDDDLKEDFNRQRERYYHAESLRNFARDNVPDGTFDNLKDEIYHGVVDKCNINYPNGLVRMRETLSQASQLNPASNPLVEVLKIPDKTGICHHLSNDDKLIWVKNEK